MHRYIYICTFDETDELTWWKAFFAGLPDSDRRVVGLGIWNRGLYFFVVFPFSGR